MDVGFVILKEYEDIVYKNIHEIQQGNKIINISQIVFDFKYQLMYQF